ncbi:MAG: HNH endonuclease, partial [Novosphingobium sp.]
VKSHGMSSETGQRRAPQRPAASASPSSGSQALSNPVFAGLQLEKVVGRMIGTQPKSLGLHPFVYFYTAKGRHYPPLMLAMFSIIAEKVRNNDGQWFRIFTERRSAIEKLLIEHKGILTLLISALGSKARLEGSKKALIYIFDEAVDPFAKVTPNDFAEILGLESRLYTIQSKPGADFTDDAKSSAFLRESLRQALKCPLCGGYLDPTKSASYDHIIRKIDGGTGDHSNCQITHPYCNSIKN